MENLKFPKKVPRQLRLRNKKSTIGVPADAAPINPSAMDHTEELLLNLSGI